MIRQKLIRLAPLACISLLVLGACGSDAAEKKPSARRNGDAADGTGSPGGAALSADERACEDFYKVQLEWTGRCGGILNRSQPAVSRFRKLCARQLAAPGSAGLREARARCAEKMKEAACDQEIPECELPPGSLADGEPCAGRAQCQSKYCKLDDSGCGVCAKLVEPGGECLSPADCAIGDNEVASCDYRQGSTKGACSIWKLARANQTCNAETLCDVRSHCDVPDQNAKQGTCLANLDLGKTCDANRACRPGLVCLDEKCSEKPNEGEACNAIDACADGLACDGTCKPVVYVGVRETCDTVRRCARGRCVQPVTTDQDGKATPAGDATCVDPIPDGAPCGPELAAQGQVCELFAQCLGGRCVLEDPNSCK